MAKTFNVSFPEKLVKEIDRVAKREGRSRSEFLRTSALSYLDWRQRWVSLQRIGRKRARELGIRPGDVNRLIHEYRGVKET